MIRLINGPTILDLRSPREKVVIDTNNIVRKSRGGDLQGVHGGWLPVKRYFYTLLGICEVDKVSFENFFNNARGVLITISDYNGIVVTNTKTCMFDVSGATIVRNSDLNNFTISFSFSEEG